MGESKFDLGHHLFSGALWRRSLVGSLLMLIRDAPMPGALSATRWQSQHNNGPARSLVKGTLEYLSPNDRDSTPRTVGGRSFERETAKLTPPADPNPRQPGSRLQMLPFTVTHSSLQNWSALPILLSGERNVETKRLRGFQAWNECQWAWSMGYL